MKAKKLSEILMEHPEADVKIRVEREQMLSEQTTGMETLMGDLLKESVFWTDKKYVIASDLCDLESEN